MAEQEPVAETMYAIPEARVLPWAEARERIAHGSTHWLATVRPDGRPHVVPVGVVWFDGALYFTTGQGTQKEKNIIANPHCVISVSNNGFDLVVEGEGAHLRDAGRLEQVAAVYRAQGWPATARDGTFDAPYSAPTTGPAPYEVYEVTPRRAFALGTTGETVNQCTRYRF